MSPSQKLHNLVLNMIKFSFQGLMETCVECRSISLLALLVHLHNSPWERQHRAQPDIIIHSLECTQPHSTPIIKVYFASRDTCWIHSIGLYIMGMMTWAENCLHCLVSLEMGSVFLSSLMERGTWIGGARDLLSHQINKTLVEKVSRLHYRPLLNLCDIILL